MCGRVTLDFDIEMLKDILEGALNVEQLRLDPHGDYHRRYNIGPGQNILSVIDDGREKRAGYMRWGFIPPYAKDHKEGYKLINSKAETIDVKPTFKESFINRRCVILADSFYEWHASDYGKQAYRILIKDQAIMPMAGVWSKYIGPDGQTIFSCAIITTAANDMMKRIHHRMPVILRPDSYESWLKKDSRDPLALKNLLVPYASEAMTMYPVSSLVNNVRLDCKECIDPL